VIAYGCLIKRKEARREHLDYIYRGLMTQHAKVHCNIHLCRSSADRRFQEISTIGKQLKLMRKSLARHELTSISRSIE
jgi:hypothetical protein